MSQGSGTICGGFEESFASSREQARIVHGGFGLHLARYNGLEDEKVRALRSTVVGLWPTSLGNCRKFSVSSKGHIEG
jgi:hypothetical protein